MRRARVVRFILLLFAATALALPGGALADTLPASLSGENFFFGAADVVSDCHPDGTSTTTFTGSGQANGPYPGTATETATFTYGPQTFLLPSKYDIYRPSGQMLTVDVRFTIDSPNGAVTGTKRLLVTDDPLESFGTCEQTVSGFDTPGRTPPLTDVTQYWQYLVQLNERYDATISTAGGIYRDTGQAYFTASAAQLWGTTPDGGSYGVGSGGAGEFFTRSDGVAQQATTPCPAGVSKVNARWHYSANASAGGWSGTKSTSCIDGSITMGPQAMEGDLKVSPGAALKAGYDFTLPGNSTPRTALVGRPQAVFTVRCVSGEAPSAATLTVPMPEQTYALLGSEWTPSGDQRSPLVFQGEITVPDLCDGGRVRLDKGGTFTATIRFS